MKASGSCKIQVIIRGIERRVIFRDDLDRENFLERLSDLIPETQSACFARVFMSNQKRAWQETGYVLSIFGGSPAAGRSSYAVSYAVSRGEQIAKERSYNLLS